MLFSYLHVLNNQIKHTLHSLQEPCPSLSCFQLTEIVSLLTDGDELIDWRRFLLSAALPWPFPSLTQLLVTLQHFKAVDTGDTGYINEEQYLQVSVFTQTQMYTLNSNSDSGAYFIYSSIKWKLPCSSLNIKGILNCWSCLLSQQTELWFSNDMAQPVSEDPSQPLTYDHLANLRKVNYCTCNEWQLNYKWRKSFFPENEKFRFSWYIDNMKVEQWWRRKEKIH